VEAVMSIAKTVSGDNTTTAISKKEEEGVTLQPHASLSRKMMVIEMKMVITMMPLYVLVLHKYIEARL
jgi:hypothetical protein